MDTSGRRNEIIRILVCRRKTTIGELAREFGVSKLTIQRDIGNLILEYPIEQTCGKNGGISIPEWYHPYCRMLSDEQAKTLRSLLPKSDERQATVLRQLISEYSTLERRI